MHFSEYKFDSLRTLSVFYTKFHGVLRRYKLTNVGISFPDCIGPDDPGLRLYLVSDSKTLNVVNNALNITELLLAGSTEKTNEGEVPPDCKWKVFRRDRSLERNVGKKAQARITKVPMNEKMGTLNKLREEYLHKTQTEAIVIHKGRNSGNKVILRLKVDEVDGGNHFEFNSYGLSGVGQDRRNEKNPLTNQSAVPVF